MQPVAMRLTVLSHSLARKLSLATYRKHPELHWHVLKRNLARRYALGQERYPPLHPVQNPLQHREVPNEGQRTV